jgi:hypothetical protein
VRTNSRLGRVSIAYFSSLSREFAGTSYAFALREGADAMIATATLHTIWDCRWSRPGYRLLGVEEHLQPETLWVCDRHGERRGVTEVDCENCPHWEARPQPLTMN